MMETYLVPYLEEPIDWERAPAVPLLPAPWTPPCGIAASARMCWSAQALHVCLTAAEPEIRATLSGPLDMVCEDSCLEFFFAPAASDPRYFNFEFNPLGCLYLGFGSGRQDRIRLLLPDGAGLLGVECSRTLDGWRVIFRIPVSFIRLFFPDFQIGTDSKGNFFKCGEKTAAPHYLTWNPMSGTRPDFHRPQDFGWLRCGPRTAGTE